MLSIETAGALQAAGVRWDPAPGDRFVVEVPERAGQVFVVGDGARGPADRALDSLDQERVLWLPRETQLRHLLAGTFRLLEHDPAGAWTVHIQVGDRAFAASHDDAEQAYGLALLHLVDAGE